MATTKKRIVLSLPRDVEQALTRAAGASKIPTATKAVEALALGLAVSDEYLFALVADRRDAPNARYVSHEDVWGTTKSRTTKK